ncbi:MAG: Histone deacetylase-like amidohydrolase [Anaerolineae bacterium]|nr:Histone deacetylase-like amidohydrolase [Anaerolineae bacterium]
MTTGYVYERVFHKHNWPDHPENARRLSAVMDYLSSHDILPRLVHIPSREAKINELQLCHHPLYIEMVEDTCRFGGGMLDADTYTNKFSFEAAAHAAGGLIDLSVAVVKGELDNGFALIRPPGHHAIPNRAMGFCLFGNTAIAARAAQYITGIERVAIVDFDVHHGNGTQAILEEDPTVMFVSSHQYPFYPGTGAIYQTGTGPAEGTKINLPLSVMMGDEDIKRLYGEVVFPLLRRFQPQLIIVSAGFDAHWDDPLANIGLTLTGYQWLVNSLIGLAGELCDGKIVFALEGGYNLQVLAPGVGNTFRALLGETDVDDPLGISPWVEPDVSSLLSQLKKIHAL